MNIEILSSARQELASLPPSTLRAVDRQILTLADNPQPPEARVLSADDRLWYLLGEGYRVVYQLDEDSDRILIVKISLLES